MMKAVFWPSIMRCKILAVTEANAFCVNRQSAAPLLVITSNRTVQMPLMTTQEALQQC